MPRALITGITGQDVALQDRIWYNLSRKDNMPYKDPDKRREAARAATARWRANHPEEAKETNRQYDLRRSERRKPYKREIEKARYRANPGLEREQAKQRRVEAPEVNRVYKLKKFYGMTLEQYQALFEEQNGCCAACHLPPEEGKLLVVDHDHKTGRVRGLLHNNCNVIIGMTREDGSLLFHIAEYMEKHHD